MICVCTDHLKSVMLDNLPEDLTLIYTNDTDLEYVRAQPAAHTTQGENRGDQ